jgi:hypothetical protein
MNIEGLTLRTERCPDGVELVDLPEVWGKPLTAEHQPRGLMLSEGALAEYQPAGKVFRHRTERREPKTIAIENLENPVVLQFANATSDNGLLNFFERYGLQGHPVFERDSVLEQQHMFHAMLENFSALNQTAPTKAVEGINRFFELPPSELSYGEFDLRPSLHLGGPQGTPRMLLKTKTLRSFMLMEMAMIVAHGAMAHKCDKCGTIFLTGQLTWRRSTARFCSDRCRVAANRAKKTEAN